MERARDFTWLHARVPRIEPPSRIAAVCSPLLCRADKMQSQVHEMTVWIRPACSLAKLKAEVFPGTISYILVAKSQLSYRIKSALHDKQVNCSIFWKNRMLTRVLRLSSISVLLSLSHSHFLLGAYICRVLFRIVRQSVLISYVPSFSNPRYWKCPPPTHYYTNSPIISSLENLTFQ